MYIITVPLSIILNQSFQSGVLPQDWKVAYITLIHKKGSYNVTGNYRPVSLMSTIVKVMESIVKSSIFDYLISNNLISSNQFGFLPGHSCTMQLLHVMDIITSSPDHGQPVDVIYLDLQKLLILYRTTDYYLKLRAMVLVGNF